MGDVIDIGKGKRSRRQTVRDNKALTALLEVEYVRNAKLRESNDRLIRFLGILVEREIDAVGRCAVTGDEIAEWGKGSLVDFHIDPDSNRILLTIERTKDEEKSE